MKVPGQPVCELNRCSRNVYVPVTGAVNSHDSHAGAEGLELQAVVPSGLRTIKSISAPSTSEPPLGFELLSHEIATFTRWPATRLTGWLRLPLPSKSPVFSG